MSSGVRLAAATWVKGRAPNLCAQLTAASPGVGAGRGCRHRCEVLECLLLLFADLTDARFS